MSELALMVTGEVLNTRVSKLEPIKLKRLSDSSNRLDLLPDRIEQDARKLRQHMEGNTREPSTGSHIEEPTLGIIGQQTEEQRVKNMKNQSVAQIGDAREIDIGIDLLNIEQMPNKRLKVYTRDFKLSIGYKPCELVSQRRNQLLLTIQGSQDNRAFGMLRHQAPLCSIVTEISVSRI